MRQYIRKIGHIRSVVLFSTISILISLLTTISITLILRKFGAEVGLEIGLWIGFLVPLIVSPTIGWFIIGMLLKIDQMEADMRLLATYDTLTGLLTRREFLEQTNFFHKVAVREKIPYALIIADLDKFKEINDNFGHLAGDQTLETFGSAIQNNLRESDLACRFGGDEFLFFLPNCTSSQAWQFGERLHSIANQALTCPGRTMPTSMSLGIACFPDHQSENIEEMISAADKAMYIAKKSGGNKTQQSEQGNIS